MPGPKSPTITDLRKLARHLAANGPVKTLPATPRRIRIMLNGVMIADSTKASYVWEHQWYPQYYLPSNSLIQKSPVEVRPEDEIKDDSGNVIAELCKIAVGEKSCQGMRISDKATGKIQALAGMVKVDFNGADQWFEEDTPIMVHPKDPYKRIDLISSMRPVRVSVGGHKVAESSTSVHLYETGLPVRFYVPLTSLDTAVLQRSDLTTQCPYKGEAEYYHVVINGKEYKDIVWFYTRPTIECAGVAGLCCFYNEKVDIELMEDGKWEKLESPKGSPFA